MSVAPRKSFTSSIRGFMTANFGNARAPSSRAFAAATGSISLTSTSPGFQITITTIGDELGGPDREGHDRQRGVHLERGREDAPVRHEEAVHVVDLEVGVHDARLRLRAHARRPERVERHELEVLGLDRAGASEL